MFVTDAFVLIGMQDVEDARRRDVVLDPMVLSVDANNVQKHVLGIRCEEVVGTDITTFDAYLLIEVLYGDMVLGKEEPSGLRSSYSYRLPSDRYGTANAIRVTAYGDEKRAEPIAEGTAAIVRDNPIPFPRSEAWNAELKYQNGEYLMVGDVVYMWRNPVAGNSTLSPDEDLRQNGVSSSWTAYQNWPVLATQVFLAQWAKLGSAVFNGDYMFSQHGKDSSGKDTDDYRTFDPSMVGQNGAAFNPQLLVDWKTGKMWGNAVNLKDAYVSGEIVATKGQIGKFSIDSEGLYAGSGDNTVRITPTSFILKKGLSYGNSPISKTQIGFADGAYELSGKDPGTAMTGVYIYRRGLAAKWNDDAVDLYAPALRVVSDNVANRDVAIRAEGGSIVAGGGIMSFINAYNGNEYTVLPIDKGGDHMIYNTTYRVIYLPTRKMLNVALGRTTIGTAAVRLCVVNHPMSTADFVLRFQSGDPGTIYDHNGKALGELRMAKGDCFEFYLVCEPNLYWAQEINSTVGI